MEAVLEEGASGGAEVALEGAGGITVAVTGGVPTGG